MGVQKQLLAYPMVDELEYRQNIDSKQLNKMLQSIEQSILRTIIRSTKLSTKIDALNLGIINSYNALYAHEKRSTAYPVFYKTCFANAFNTTLSGGRQNQNAGIVTLDWDNFNKQSKIPIINNVISPNVSILVDGTARPQDDPVYNILDSDPKTFWIEETSAGEHTLEIQLPPSLNKRFNYLEVIPFPVFGIEITKIKYSDPQSIEQTIFDTTSTSDSKPYRFYNNSGPLVFHLAPREYNNTVTITYNIRNGVSAMGFSNIDISFIDYFNTVTTVLIPFENLPDETTITPTKIDLDFFIDGPNVTNITKFFSKNGGGIYISDNNGTDLGGIAPIQGAQEKSWAAINITNGLWLKVVMNEVNTTSPVFRGCELEYTV